MSVVYSPNGKQIASGGDKTVRLWDTHTGARKRTLQGHTGWVYSVAYAPIASGSADATVRLWEIKKEGEDYKAVLCWSSGRNSFLTVRGISIEGVVGLSEMNKKLLKQRETMVAV